CSWGKPMAALLGALRIQAELGLPSIGGKDSMSGTFQDINVPPMLMAFGITTVDAATVVSTDFKRPGSNLYLIRHTPRANHMPDTGQLRRNFGFVSGRIEVGQILSAWAVGFGGVAEGLAKMAFGNEIGAEVAMDERRLFGYAYGSILVECEGELDFPDAEFLGRTTDDAALTVNGVRMPLDELYRANTERFASVYPDKGHNCAEVMTGRPRTGACEYPGPAVEHPRVCLPVFPGTNCDYDTAKAFRCAGAEVETCVLCNIGSDDILRSIARLRECIDRCHILVLSGGFSAGDEPDGSAKFIVNVLNNTQISEAIHALLDRGGLILGICNGFQALVKSGLLPYGRLGMVTASSPTLFRNDINRHISQIVATRVASTASPWLAGFEPGQLHSIAVSHGEGKFVVGEELARELFDAGQVAFQYAGPDGEPTAAAPWNPNGSSYAIEGIVSRDGRILGKMGHTERWEEHLFKNIAGNKQQDLFGNAVRYFRKK
ncbi:MAG: phosphoribosylformylglycinamidine synthase subunit PurQ, partial [Alistipes sp.]|nr:phosphoribosylformylglycinamidine synthase subunit PurQ [Alistipes sp.]